MDDDNDAENDAVCNTHIDKGYSHANAIVHSDNVCRDNYCDECDTTQYTFDGQISTIIQRNCGTSSECHGTGTINSDFTSYEAINQQAFNIEQRAIIYKNMPLAYPISDCDMLLLKKWIDSGAQNN